MKSNESLQADVQNAIKWEPLLHAAEIGVTAKDGIVSLTGTVDNYTKKVEAENATKRVIGVKAIVEKIEVKFPSSWTKTNEQVAQEALDALKTTWSVPQNKVTTKVEDGWVTLGGDLPWNYQKVAAENAVHHLTGVKGVTNNIHIKSETQDSIEQEEVENALARSWSLGDNSIRVSVSGTKVTLKGMVRSWYQKDEAERVAWSTPGIGSVDNQLVVDYYYEMAY
jgi:osmotically-inducible protein OsmY